MGEKKIVIDTNNLISALGWDGNSRILLLRVIVGDYTLYISKAEIDELCRVMDYPKFKFNKEQKTKFLEIIYSIANVIDTKIKLSVVEDKDDNMILETAVEVGATHIVSGDKHLRKIRLYDGIRIVSAKELLDMS